MHPMLNTAIKAARRGAALINRAARDIERIQINEKERNDFVTEIDHSAQAAILEVLQTAYPDHTFLCEETLPPGVNAASALSENVWIIDPLDGTTNFIHGFPQYSISIALQHQGQITQALVFDPNRNELFVATKGAGAFLNDRRIRVSKCIRLSHALLGTGFPYRDGSQLESYIALFRAFTERCAGLRRPGSAALDLAYVAAGRLDGFFEFGLHAWDVAAGSLLIQEAGGMNADFSGQNNYLHGAQILAANPKIFAQMLPVIQDLLHD